MVRAFLGDEAGPRVELADLLRQIVTSVDVDDLSDERKTVSRMAAEIRARRSDRRTGRSRFAATARSLVRGASAVGLTVLIVGIGLP